MSRKQPGSPQRIRLVPPAAVFEWIPLSITLSPKPTVPGQPLAFSFSVQSITTATLDIGNVTLSLYLIDASGNMVFGSANPLFTQKLASDEKINPAPYSSHTFSFFPPAAQQTAAWTINSGYYLILVLTGDGKDGGPYSSNYTVPNVGFENIDASWWTWTVDYYRKVQWKVDDYPINGQFINHSQYSAFVLNAIVVNETNFNDQDPPNNAYSADQNAVTVAAKGGVQAVTFSKTHFAKTFTWYVDGIYKPDWNLVDKTFSYSIELDLKDQWGNAYPTPDFQDVFVDVVVSDQKQHACTVAFTAFGIWVAESLLYAAIAWLGPIVAGVAAISTAALAAMGIAGKIASDPPAPDPKYATGVEVLVPRLSDAIPPKIADAMGTALAILAAVDALSTIEGRIMGAALAKDDAAEQQQRNHYAQLVKEIEAKSRRMNGVAQAAMPELDPATLVAALKAREAASHTVATPVSMPSDLRKTLIRAQLSGAGLPPFDAAQCFDAFAASARDLGLAAVEDARRVLYPN